MTDRSTEMSVRDIAEALAAQAHAFCADWLPDGRLVGGKWVCGDVYGSDGRSMSVTLTGPRAGKWMDFAEDTFGDLIDIIQQQRSLSKGEAVKEAKDWLGLVEERPVRSRASPRPAAVQLTPVELARKAQRLFALGRAIEGTPAETYLRNRGIIEWGPALRYLATTFYVGENNESREMPALLCAITDNDGMTVGVNRIYLSPKGTIADVPDPKKVLGRIAGSAVRFGTPGDVLLVGEGVETMLSLKTAAPHLPVAAALARTHLALFDPPPRLRQLWIARDSGAPGEDAAEKLRERLADLRPDLAVGLLKPRTGDFNDRLVKMGPKRLARRLKDLMGGAFEGILSES